MSAGFLLSYAWWERFLRKGHAIMEVMAPYLTLYLLGMVTSIFFFRQLMRCFTPHDNIEGYLLDLLSLGIFLLIGITVYVWLCA